MTTDDQSKQIAIAKFCGWRWHGVREPIPDAVIWSKAGDAWHSPIPNYFEDYAALREAVLMLPDGLRDDYSVWCMKEMRCSMIWNYESLTCRQRAECLYETIKEL